MKKFIYAIIVLVLADAAFAGVIDVLITSKNGEAIAPVKEITINQSDIIGMDVLWTSMADRYLFNLGFDVISDGPATLDGSSVIWHFQNHGCVRAMIFYPQEPNRISIYSDCGMTLPHGPSAVIVSNILLHCEAAGEVKVRAVNNPGLYGGTVEVDSNYDIYPVSFGPGVVIHQADPPPACWQCPGQPSGDATGDGNVGLSDLTALRRSWMKTCADPYGTYFQYNCCADFNHDCIVNISDLVILKKNWLKTGLGTCSDITCPESL